MNAFCFACVLLACLSLMFFCVNAFCFACVLLACLPYVFLCECILFCMCFACMFAFYVFLCECILFCMYFACMFFVYLVFKNSFCIFCFQDIVASYTADEDGQTILVEAREKGDSFFQNNEALLKKVEEKIQKIQNGEDAKDEIEPSAPVKKENKPQKGVEGKDADDKNRESVPVTPKVGTSRGKNSPSQAPELAKP